MGQNSPEPAKRQGHLCTRFNGIPRCLNPTWTVDRFHAFNRASPHTSKVEFLRLLSPLDSSSKYMKSTSCIQTIAGLSIAYMHGHEINPHIMIMRLIRDPPIRTKEFNGVRKRLQNIWCKEGIHVLPQKAKTSQIRETSHILVAKQPLLPWNLRSHYAFKPKTTFCNPTPLLFAKIPNLSILSHSQSKNCVSLVSLKKILAHELREANVTAHRCIDSSLDAAHMKERRSNPAGGLESVGTGWLSLKALV